MRVGVQHVCDHNLLYVLTAVVMVMFIIIHSLAVAIGNTTDDVDNELISHNCWLDVLLKFRSIAQRPLGAYQLFICHTNHLCCVDPQAMYMASLSSSQLLLGKQGGTVMGMLNSGHPLIAMATLMYSNISLQEVRVQDIDQSYCSITC